MTKPLILISNDDGYEAKGLQALIEAAIPFGEVVVVTTDTPRSGFGHAITSQAPLFLNLYKKENDLSIYRTNGTPVDCVKLGEKVVLRDRKIDLFISGFNHGSNSSVSLIYSGTMGAAIEAAFDNIPSIGFSLSDYSADADFSAAKIFASKIISKVLLEGLPPHICLNVNVPKASFNEIKGIKITRQTLASWHEDLEEHKDPYGRSYYWLSGYLNNFDPHPEDTCEFALKNNYVSIQPVQYDLTAYQYINTFKKWEE